MLPEVTAADVRSTAPGEHTGAGLVIATVGNGFIVIIAAALDGHGANEYEATTFTVYVPGVLAAKSISPLLGFITRPAVEVNVNACDAPRRLDPVSLWRRNTGSGGADHVTIRSGNTVPDPQKGPPGYVRLVSAGAKLLTATAFIAESHPVTVSVPFI
ncbi:hypothetical protein FLCH110379_18165 [Flavobacterium chungbukense]